MRTKTRVSLFGGVVYDGEDTYSVRYLSWSEAVTFLRKNGIKVGASDPSGLRDAPVSHPDMPYRWLRERSDGSAEMIASK